MKKRFKRDLIYEFIDELKADEKEKAIEIVKVKFEKVKSEVKELKDLKVNEDFFRIYRFYEHLKGLLFFLKYENIPNNLNPKIFLKFRWIAERLVKKKEMAPKVLELFERQ